MPFVSTLPAARHSRDNSQIQPNRVSPRNPDFWIGVTDVLLEGHWNFPCGNANYSYPWCPGEPNDGGGGIGSGDCVRIIGRSGPGNGNCAPGHWADFRCDVPQDNDHQPVGFVCEINREKVSRQLDLT